MYSPANRDSCAASVDWGRTNLSRQIDELRIDYGNVRSVTQQHKARDPVAALSRLYSQHVDRVYGFLLARCGSPTVAEELTATTFEHAARSYDRVSDQELGVGWLLTVARRRLIEHWRTQERDHKRLDKLRSKAIVASIGEPAFEDDCVSLALESLSSRQRAALSMRYLDDYSVAEVAEALEATYTSAESLLARARRSFAAAYEKHRLHNERRFRDG